MPPLFAAPHRLLFLFGMAQFSLAMLWWTNSLWGLAGWSDVVAAQTYPAGILHGPLLLFLTFPGFMFGFLLTVFPRWMGYPDFTALVFAPTGIGFACAAILFWTGILGGFEQGILAAFVIAALTWAWALAWMAYLLLIRWHDGQAPVWHAWFVFVGMSFGLIFLIAAALGLRTLDGLQVQSASRAAIFIGGAPVFVTVCHRMIPFFAANVVTPYQAWRPTWVLVVFWLASCGYVIAGYFETSNGQLVAAAALAVVTGTMLVRWLPRARAPGLLWVLVIGFAWAPPAYALLACSGFFSPLVARGALHLLTLGFFGSLIIAMVTRVTQGHSGQALYMPVVAWVAFAGLQIATISRLIAAILGENNVLLNLSATGLAVVLLPWAIRSIGIYSRARLDGRPG